MNVGDEGNLDTLSTKQSFFFLLLDIRGALFSIQQDTPCMHEDGTQPKTVQ